MYHDDDADRVIKELQAKIRTRELVIDTLRGLLHTAWMLTCEYEKAEEG